MGRIVRWALGLLVLNTLVWAVGQAITRSKNSRDLTGDDLELYTFWNGATFTPQSAALRRVNARVLMGGATVDLRDANPADGGSVVNVKTVMGGVAVLVRKEWAVDVVEETTASEVEIRLDQGADASDDGPNVTINLRTTLGGALVGYELPAEYDG